MRVETLTNPASAISEARESVALESTPRTERAWIYQGPVFCDRGGSGAWSRRGIGGSGGFLGARTILLALSVYTSN
jgi:hypothetical protein